MNKNKHTDLDDDLDHEGFNRRQFMRRVGATTLGAGAAYYGGTQYTGSPVQNGQAIAPLVLAGVIGAAGYLSGRAIEAGVKHYIGLGDSDDYSGLEGSSLYTQARYDFQTVKAGNDQVLTTVENLIANAKQVAYQEARAAVLEGLNNGKTLAETTNLGYDAIDGYILNNQKNVIERWDTAILQLETIVNRMSATDSIAFSEVSNLDENISYYTQDYQLADGSTTEFTGINNTPGTGPVSLSSSPSNFTHPRLYGDTQYSETTYDRIQMLDRVRFRHVLQDLATAWSDARTEIDTFVNGIADSYTAGEISTEDITKPSDLFQMASEDSENPYAAADLAGLGLKVNQSSSMTVELLDDDEILDGSVYLSKSPMGESLQLGTVYNPNNSRATDSSGNLTDTIDDYAGTLDDPVPLDGLVYIAYNTGDGSSTYAQIQQPFTVTSASDGDGNNLSEVGYQPSKGQQTTTTDITELRSELQAMNDEIVRLEEEKREEVDQGGSTTGSGGAGGFLDGGNSTLLAALAVVAGGAVLFGGNS
jgi:hypothetical protein